MDTTSQSSGVQEKTTQPDPIRVSLDWNECTSRSGKKYYYNKRTKVSSWEKPLEMMTLTERADATTDWREVASSDGRKYYYNKITYQSTWAIPHEIKLARERANTSMASDPSASLEVASPSPNATSNVEEAGKLGKEVKI